MATTEVEVTIRPMTQDDIDAVFEIDRKIGADERAFTYADLITGYIGGQIGYSFVAETSGKVVGFAMAAITYVPEQVTEACVIQVIGIDPDCRRQGIARKLIEALVRDCRSKGLKMVRVMVDQHDGQLQGLFESMDFRRGQLIDYSINI
ncbi:MAG: GNAT family N-acetyltransferase [Chloroflexi bacterium]|jgi:ribosomal protein S18 acetylase RimI-like enzyme|nr:GNAT family N-acetyltransferase [Chloroflexota bacterium]